MFYGDQVQDTRRLFFVSWQKYRQDEPLSPLEKQIVEVVTEHPEYHALLESTTTPHDTAYFPELGETNPFLHMGLHLAIRDQVATDRPVGIKEIYGQLANQYKDTLKAEHALMDCLAECLWQAQRHKTMPDESGYLQACRLLFSKE